MEKETKEQKIKKLENKIRRRKTGDPESDLLREKISELRWGK